MTAKYLAILTNQGAARLANAAALGTKLNLTQMAVGDANGTLPTPDPAQTKLINQKRIAPLNLLTVDPANTSQIIAEQIIPENEGGFWIREIGLYDDDGILIAVANCPETYKPQLQEGSGRTQTIRMILIVSSTSSITLKIDPSVVLATRKYVDDKVLELRVYVDDLMAKHLAAADPHTQYATKESPTLTGTPKAPTAPAGTNTTQIASTAFVQAVVTALNNELALKAPLASPTLTGTPTAPTAAQTVNNTQVATTAFVKSAIAALVASSPAALDTLNELAAALGNDPNFATTMTNALAGKQQKDATLTNLSGKDVAGLLQYLGLGEGSALPVGVPIPWPSATPPTGWLKCNGAAFTASQYPRLALAYPALKLPDLRGEFIRGWDDGRGVDTGRSIMSQQQGSLMALSVSANTEDDRISVMHVYGPPGYDALISGVGMDSMAGYQKIFGINKLSSDKLTPEITSPLDITVSGQPGVGGVSRPRNVAFNYIVRAA
ncbi:phage tail protein [Cronobacter sakazakii]|nr:phage tail protein [Cronobacter sakazakii]ELY2539328.1 phage tail protein [Cronobacter sakazakii]ELY4822118.1 phage tail protein [Cronobacter sakazakii]ELY4838506.1 phage tail protein [Cronobacter sakazakii]ELY5864101.1 phage tail protein [Cronobacter sakazakii]